MASVRLMPHESVLMVTRPAVAAVWPRYLLTLGLYGLWHKRRVTVLTSQRLMLGEGVFSRREHSIPIRAMRDADYSRRGLFSFCDVTSSDGRSHHLTRVGPMPTKIARRFVYELQSRLSTS